MFCTSESSTAICRSTTTDHSTIHIGGSGHARAIDRHNPIIHPSRRSLSSISSSSSHNQNLKAKATDVLINERRKSSASLVDVARKSSCIKPSPYLSPPPSMPHLILSKSQSVTLDTDKDGTDSKTGGQNLVKCSSLKLKNDAPSSDKYYYSPFRVNSHQVQVVVVRVSLHCKGCAGKVKKYISRMQGVTSFNVDFDAKKVIVVGDVTPLEVLASISKVRTAQLLPPEKPNATLGPFTNNTKQVTGEPKKRMLE